MAGESAFFSAWIRSKNSGRKKFKFYEKKNQIWKNNGQKI